MSPVWAGMDQPSPQLALLEARQWVLRAALDVAAAQANLADPDLLQLRWQELDRCAAQLARAVENCRGAFTPPAAVHHIRDGDAGLAGDRA